MELSTKHMHEGGTAVTNFDPSRRPVYEEAIKRSGRTDLELSDWPFGGRGLKGDHCLHVTSMKHDLSDFWAVFDEVKKEHAALKAAGLTFAV